MIALILLIRFLSYQPELKLTPYTWRRFLITALLVAQKFWDDRCLRNVDFTLAWKRVLPGAERIHLREINLMERLFLTGLGYDLFIMPTKCARARATVARALAAAARAPRAHRALVPLSRRLRDAPIRSRRALAHRSPLSLSRARRLSLLRARVASPLRAQVCGVLL